MYEFRIITFTDFVIGSFDENIYNGSTDSIKNIIKIKEKYQSSQNDEIDKKKETDSQDSTDPVYTREAKDTIKDELNITKDQATSVPNVIEHPSEIEFRLSDMAKPVASQTNRLKLSDLVELPPEGFILKLSDLIKPPKKS